jgi:beta-lactamase regulating signal transducer with metallopeptidase domain
MNLAHIAIGLFNATWQSAALILATFLGLRACRNVGAGARCALWSAVFFLSALLPIAGLAMQRTLVIASHGPAALPARATATFHRSAHVRPANARVSLASVASVRSGAGQSYAAPAVVSHAAPALPVPAAATANPFVAPQLALQSLAGVLLAMYFLGVTFFGIRLSREYLALLALKRRCSVVAGDPYLVGDLPRDARLATSIEVQIPCVLGFFSPIIVLPVDMIEEVSAADLRRVIAHEAAHLDRRDDWTNLVEQLVLAAFFYNPAMHFAIRQIATEREIACDDSVVMREGDTVTYAECLASLVHRASCGSHRLPAPGFAAGPRQIVVRIERLLDRAYGRSRRFGAGMAVTAAVVLFLAVAGVGNTVPVIADAFPAVPAPPLAPLAPLATLPPAAKAPLAKPAPLMKSAPLAPHAPVAPQVSEGRPSPQLAPRVTPPVVPAPPLAMHPAPAVPPSPVRALRGNDSLLAALSASGYQNLSVDELVGLSDAGLSGNAILVYASLFGHPSIAELRSLANHGISLGYVASIKAAGLPNVTPRDAIRLFDYGISAADVSKYIRTLRSPNVNDILRLHNSGVE